MRYAELHCQSNFSFLEAASHPEELVQRAADLGYAALALTDSGSLAGMVRAHTAAKEVGLHLIVGAQFSFPDAPSLATWVTDRKAYGRLCRLITVGRRRAEKGVCKLTFDDLAEHAEGLLAGILPADQHLTDPAGLHRHRELFGDRCYLLAELHRGPDDVQRLRRLQALSQTTRIPLAAAGGVLYHVPARLVLHDVLTAIRHKTTVAELETAGLLQPNAERHLQSREDIACRFAEAPDAVRRTLEIAARTTFSLDELRYEYPEELAPPGLTPHQYLTQLAWAGAGRRYPGGVPPAVRQTIEHELRLIEKLRYEAYFLTVWDLMRFARERGILCQGRGSAANSAVCYCLEITAVDPERIDLLFERFVSQERDEAPDIDIDFEHERREEVLQYLYEKYGRERAGLAAVTITYRSRSAIRDAGKALGLSLPLVDTLAKNADGYRDQPDLPLRCRQAGFDPDAEIGRRLVYVVQELIGFPRHLSQHVGGMVMTRGPLCELVPIENAAMPGRTVVQWNKDDLDDLGILKVDCLALGMLTAIRKCFDLVQKHTGETWTLATIPPEDLAVFDMICQADTVGVFQIESRAQMSMLPRLRPRCFYDLVIEVAIVRPGPIQGGMVHPYLRRRCGAEEETYPNDAIRAVLKKTLGVPIFQEQAMRLAVVAAGFTPGEADQLRRAMGAWRRPGIIDKFHRQLIDGMTARGLSGEFAQQVFQQIRGFGEYGFPESHAASFALLVYASAWLKCHYPAAFTAAVLNSQPMGFYAPAQLIRDARQHGIEVRPADVHASDWDCTLEGEGTGPFFGQPAFPCKSVPTENMYLSPWNQGVLALRLGLRLLSGLSPSTARVIEHAQAEGRFTSVADFARRTGLGRGVIQRLAKADAFASLALDRRSSLWDSLAQDERVGSRPLLDALVDDEAPSPLPAMSLQEEVYADYRTVGLSLRAHPISFFRQQLRALRVTPAGELSRLRNGRPVRVAGLVLLRQRPSTAKGITFVTLEDETGLANLVVHQRTWERFHAVTRHAAAWLASGRLEIKDSIVHVIVGRLEDLSGQLRDVHIKSRDFR